MGFNSGFKGLMWKSETYPTRLMYTARRRNISGVRRTGTINSQTGVRIAFAMVTEAVAIPVRSRWVSDRRKTETSASVPVQLYCFS